MATILQIIQYQVGWASWTPLMLAGKLSQATIVYSADLKLRSDPDDPSTEYICRIKDGTSYTVTGIPTAVSSQTLVYAQSVEGTQTITVSFGRVVATTAGGGGGGVPDPTGHAGQFLSTDGSFTSWQPLDGGIF